MNDHLQVLAEEGAGFLKLNNRDPWPNTFCYDGFTTQPGMKMASTSMDLQDTKVTSLKHPFETKNS